MKKVILTLSSAIVLSCCPTFAIAQSSLERSAVDAGAALIGGLFKKKKSKPREETQEMSYSSSGSDAYAGTQQSDRGAIRIVTGHPDLKVKVRRCEASGNTLFIDLTLTNVGTSDVKAVVQGGVGRSDDHTEVVDDQGNIYKATKIKVANSNEYIYYQQEFSLITDVPVKLSVRVDGVPESSEAVARLLLNLWSMPLGLEYGHTIQVRNIPISRE